MSDRVAVIGAGSWGTAVAGLVAATHPTSLWVRSPELADSIQRTRENATYLSGVRLPDGLTARQAEVLRLLAAGMSNKEIAAALYLSPSTVERHLATIYRKLGLGGRVEAARYAVEHGLAQNPNREML